jgi:hypothetical protein
MSDGGHRNEQKGDPPDEDLAAFQSRLGRLKREGCNLLVVGDAPRKLFTQASASMLGDADARRWRVFGLTDAPPESVQNRLPAASVTPRPRSETTKIVSHPVASQRTTDTAEATANIPEVTISETGLSGFRNELLDATEQFSTRSHRPAEVRLSVDSLVPLLDRYDHESVRQFLQTVTARIHDWNAMAHYVLPVAYDSDRCQGLVNEFDAVVELRTSSERTDDRPSSEDSSQSYQAEERWHLPESGATMPWVSL